MTILKGKTAIVTGSTSGIGEGIARALAAQGANIVLNGFGDTAAIETLRNDIETKWGVKVLYDGADIGKPDQIRALCANAAATFTTIDILVNNAGIQYVAPIDQFPDDKWDAIIAINMTSAFHFIKAVLPGMRKAGWGRIINIASAHGLRASENKSAYVTAKHGIVGLTKTVALETARDNITCNAICPGYVNTPLVQGQIKDQAKAHNIPESEVVEKIMLAKQPTKKFVEVEQVADLASFLCTSSAQNITGAALSIDGGWTTE